MYASTIGSGPYYPVVVFNNRTWVCNVSYAKEDIAAQRAQGMIYALIEFISKADDWTEQAP